jgi:pyridoxamine 5'-phosphate oxidase
MGNLLADQRKDYNLDILDMEACPQDPFILFEEWMNYALKEDKVLEPTAMVLSTVVDNQPSSRVVLLKGIQNKKFLFYTNKMSQKGQQISENPFVSLVFFWPYHERQIRIEGRVSELDDKQNDSYFESRPFKSQLGAVVSEQSSILADRSVLEERMNRLLQEYENKTVPRPKNWGGYAVDPNRIEFWQGRRSRLHDRINYRVLPGTKGWTKERLSP